MNTQLNPSRILETATAFWPSKVLLTAVELRLFTLLANSKKRASEIASALEIHPVRAVDFLDCLVALGFLEREGVGDQALYSNGSDADFFLDRNKPSYIGGMPEMFNQRLFGFWDGLTDALRTGEAQNETKAGGPPIFEALYADATKLEEFLGAMAGIQTGNFLALAKGFDWSRYRRVVDVGGANGHLCRILAAEHPHLSLVSWDLPPVAPIATRENERAGLADRIEVQQGDFFEDSLPGADVIVMGNVLHDWNEQGKRMLIQKAHDALTSGGCLIAVENVIDDERRQNAFGLMMSLNMLIEFGAEGGFDYTGQQFDQWCRQAGFSSTELMSLAGPASAAIAYR